MIALDSSSLIAYLEGDSGEDASAVEFALAQKQVILPPLVLSELLSDPQLERSLVSLLTQLPALSILEGYWERVGRLRAGILKSGHKAKLADALIAQSCIDHEVALITRDADFRHFARSGGLKLFPGR
jgi:predicted nucleic acid-binding protein